MQEDDSQEHKNTSNTFSIDRTKNESVDSDSESSSDSEEEDEEVPKAKLTKKLTVKMANKVDSSSSSDANEEEESSEESSEKDSSSSSEENGIESVSTSQVDSALKHTPKPRGTPIGKITDLNGNQKENRSLKHTLHSRPMSASKRRKYMSR